MTLNEFDISGFTYPELDALKGMVEQRMEEMREQGIPALRQRFAEEAAALGVTLEQVVASNKSKRGRPRKQGQEEGDDLDAAS